MSLTLQEVSENPEAYKGKIVIWGGEIVQTMNQKDGTTLIAVLQRPLNRIEEPEVTKPSGGRFLVFSRDYLDAFIFEEGIKVTVAGEILGEKIKPLGEIQYRYPSILSEEVYLWRYHFYYPSRYYPWGHFVTRGGGMFRRDSFIPKQQKTRSINNALTD